MNSIPKYIKETEKAVLLTLIIDYPLHEGTGKYDVWVPKSQLDENGVPNEWIAEKKAENISMTSSYLVEGWKDAEGKFFAFGEGKEISEGAKEVNQYLNNIFAKF